MLRAYPSENPDVNYILQILGESGYEEDEMAFIRSITQLYPAISPAHTGNTILNGSVIVSFLIVVMSKQCTRKVETVPFEIEYLQSNIRQYGDCFCFVISRLHTSLHVIVETGFELACQDLTLIRM